MLPERGLRRCQQVQVDTHDGHHPAVEFVAPYRIYVPDRFFTVQIDNGAARVKAVPLPPIQSVGASQVHGSNVEIIHDVFGFAGRTQFFVVLDQRVDIIRLNLEEEDMRPRSRDS